MNDQVPLKQSFFLAAWYGEELVYVSSDQVVAVSAYDDKKGKKGTTLWTGASRGGGYNYDVQLAMPVEEAVQLFKDRGYEFVVTPPFPK